MRLNDNRIHLELRHTKWCITSIRAQQKRSFFPSFLFDSSFFLCYLSIHFLGGNFHWMLLRFACSFLVQSFAHCHCSDVADRHATVKPKALVIQSHLNVLFNGQLLSFLLVVPRIYLYSSIAVVFYAWRRFCGCFERTACAAIIRFTLLIFLSFH